HSLFTEKFSVWYLTSLTHLTVPCEAATFGQHERSEARPKYFSRCAKKRQLQGLDVWWWAARSATTQRNKSSTRPKSRRRVDNLAVARRGREVIMKTEHQGNQRLYELDLLRSITALCVITTHVLFFTAPLNPSALGTQVQQAVVTSFHFARE